MQGQLLVRTLADELAISFRILVKKRWWGESSTQLDGEPLTLLNNELWNNLPVISIWDQHLFQLGDDHR